MTKLIAFCREYWASFVRARQDRRHHALMTELYELRVEHGLTREQADHYVSGYCMKWGPLAFRADEVARWSPTIHEVLESQYGSLT